MATIFDSPQWTLKVPAVHVTDERALIDVSVVREDRSVRHVNIVIPLEMFAFAEQVLKTPVHECTLYLEQVGSCFYFGVYAGQYDQDLWFYHKSNLPSWAKPLFSVSAAKRKANE